MSTRLYKENKLRLFFENIKIRLDKIYKNKFFLNFLFNIETLMWEDIFFLTRDGIVQLCLEMIYQMGKRDRFSILKEIYQNSNNIILLFEILDNIKMKNYLPYNYDELILENHELDVLTGISKKKFNKISTNSFIVKNHLKELLYIGVELNLENKNKYIIDELISTSNGLLILLESFMPIKENSSFLLMNMEELNKYKNVEEIKQLIDNDESIKNEFIVKIFLEGYVKFIN